MYAIYNPKRLECKIASEMRLTGDMEIRGFGSNDCGCRSHLFYFKINPEKTEKQIKDISNLILGKPPTDLHLITGLPTK